MEHDFGTAALNYCYLLILSQKMIHNIVKQIHNLEYHGVQMTPICQ